MHRFVLFFFSFFSGTFLITSNNSFCLTFFLFSLRLLLHAAVCCVCVFFLCTVLLFTVSCLLGQFHVFVCYYLFSLLGSECKNRKRPLNVLLIQMICLFCTSFFFACCFVSNYSFLLNQLLLIVFIFCFCFCVLLLMLFC